MNLQDNKFITKKVAKVLIEDDWSTVKLALTRPRTLQKYPGIGAATAKKIIEEAQRLINEDGLNEAASLGDPLPTESQRLPETPAMSVRVKRLREQNQ